MQDEILPLVLAGMHFLSFKEKIFLHNKLDTGSRLALLSIDEISLLIGRQIKSRSWNGTESLHLAEQSIRLMEAYGIKSHYYSDADYPAMAREIFDPPFMLFSRGDIKALENPCVSIVGTRNPSVQGARAAFDFAKDAVEDGCTVVSGMAFGIDAAAHKGAVAKDGKSVAVLPCGADAVYPAGNRRLAVALLEKGGCLLTEYLPGTPPAKFRFPQRNRIIAALSPVTLVVEAPPKSGALITADFALEQGRDVFLHQAAFNVPEQKQGTTGYRRDGAPVVSNYREYLQLRNVAPGEVYCKIDKQLKL